MRYQLVAIAAAVTTVYAAAPQPTSYGAAPPAYPEHVPTYPSGKNETAVRYPEDKGDGSYWHDDESDYTHPPKYCPEDHEKPEHYGPAEPYKCPDDEGYEHNDKHDEAPQPPAYPEKDDKDDAPTPPVYEPKPEHEDEDKEDDYTNPPKYCPDDEEKPEHYGPAEPYKCPDDKDYEHKNEHDDVPVHPEQPKAPETKPEEPKHETPEAPKYESKPEEPKHETPEAPKYESKPEEPKHETPEAPKYENQPEAPKPETPVSPEQPKQDEHQSTAPVYTAPPAQTYPAVHEPTYPATVTPVPLPRPVNNATEPRPSVVAYTGGAPVTGALTGVGAIIAGFAAFLL